MRLVALAAAVLVVTLAVSEAGNWPQFRGPRGDAVVKESFPQEWGPETNVKWRIDNPGEGWSAPVVWGDKLFLTAAVLVKPAETGPPQEEAEGAERRNGRRGRGGYESKLTTAVYRWEVQCLNANTGELLWSRVVREGNPPLERHTSNTYATETPVTDGERVYAYFGMLGLFCFDMQGEPLWQKDLGNYEMRAGWGTASSPVLHDGKLFLQIDNQEQSFVVALDAANAEELWRIERDEPSQYSTPVVWTNSERTELVTSARKARSYDPDTGELLWELDLTGGRSSATPLAVGDRLYLGTELRNRGGDDDGGGVLFAVKAGAKGDISLTDGQRNNEYVLWTLEKSGIEMASPVISEEHLYLLERRSSVLHCVNAKTGEMVYEKRIPGARAFWASPWVQGDKVYCPDDSGTTHILQGGPAFKVLGKNTIDERIWSTAAFANGAMYLRTVDSLYCISP
ncbi:MAG: PQQ-binding-like beta-propeller repeat protein [Planctomycetaceae bacterium]|nr:PQQ-binding-like beta-propeller repeat protein [Planctomycetaceae bacterium]